MSNEKPEALELADKFENLAHPTGTRHRAATELRRQHARIQELEAMLESIGAGGASAQRGRQANSRGLHQISEDGCGDPDQTLTAIAELKDLQKMKPQQLRKIHPLDFPIEVFLADLTTRPANIIRAELASFASYAGTGTFDIEPPFTVRHLCMFSRSEMRKWPNFGRKCLNEVEEMLRARGLQLWENHDERSLLLLREHEKYFK